MRHFSDLIDQTNNKLNSGRQQGTRTTFPAINQQIFKHAALMRSLNSLFVFAFVLLIAFGFSNTANGQESSPEWAFAKLFTLSPSKDFGSAACQKQTPSGGVGAPCNDSLRNSRNTNWNSFFSYDNTSMTLTAGNDCRTVNTGSNNSCVFTLGDSGITQISFDFEISGNCHTTDCTAWLAFWVYSKPWQDSTEVDFVESLHGPAASGLNINFAGIGRQQYIYQAGNPPSTWSGSITANFSGAGPTVNASITNSVRPGIVASSTLARNNDYFFVFNTAPTTKNGCTISISNVQAKGTVSENNCIGLPISN